MSQPPQTMRAARFHAHHDIRVEKVPIPERKENEVLIDIDWCGICGSDLHEYLMGPMAIPTPGNPNIHTGDVLPITMGHEFCGRVLEAPSSSSLKQGQAVMADPRLCCRDCSGCNMNASNSCDNWGFLGLSGGGGGGLSEVVSVDERMCYPIPDDTLSLAALIEPLCVAMHAARMSEVKSWKQKSTLVIGGGPIGLAMALVLRAIGTTQIFLSEPSEKRQQQASRIADKVINPVTEKVGDVVRSLTSGAGVDVVFDCAGIKPGLVDGMDALKRFGIYVNIAQWETPFQPSLQHLIFKELKIIGSMAYVDDDFRDTVEMFSQGKFKGLDQMVTSRIILEDVVDKGFEELVNRKDHHIKIMVTPKKEYLSM